MADKEILEGPDSCTVPKWAPKKGLRYEVDDFIVSPPSNEDGGFFHLRYGQRSKPRSSTYDRINQELSMTVEIKDGDPVISDLTLSGLGSNIEAPTFSITPTGLSPTKNPKATPETSSSQSTKPLFVFHWKGAENKEGSDKVTDQQSNRSTTPTPTSDLVDALSQVSLQKSFSKSAIADAANEADRSDVSVEEYLKEKAHPKEEYQKQKEHPRREFIKKEGKLDVSLMEKVQNLKVTSPVDSTPFTSPLSTPLTTPLSSPVAKRKLAGVVMDQTVKNSYFYTKPFQGTHQSSENSSFMSSSRSDGGLSATAAHMTQQLESGAKTSLAMEPNQNLAKKRKPKPSTLREMNFWAPTSM